MKRKVVSISHKGDPRARALQVENRLQELYYEFRRNFIETGHLIVEAEDNELWKHLSDSEGNPYKSLDHWVSTALLYGRSTSFVARDIVRKFEGVPDETLQEIPRVNLEQLAKLPPAKRKSPKWIDDAMTLPNREFRSKISLVVPSTPAMRSKVERVVLNLSKSAALLMRRAFEKAGVDIGQPDAPREVLFERVCSAYLGASVRRKAA